MSERWLLLMISATIAAALPRNYSNLDTPRPPNGFQPSSKRKASATRRKELIEHHNEYGQPIPIEVERNWDKWLLHFERDVFSTHEGDNDLCPVAVLYHFNRYLYKQPATGHVKVTLSRGVSTGMIRNPYPGRPEFNYSIAFMHQDPQNKSKTFICPIKSYWYALEQRILFGYAPNNEPPRNICAIIHE